MINFDPVKHRYTKGGLVIPSVTQVIDPLVSFYAPAEVLEAARVRGTLVHSLTAGIDMDLMSLEDALEDAEKCDLVGYIKAWEAFKRDVGDSFWEVETKVYSERYNYAGTLDRVMYLRGIGSTVVDIKTGGLMPEYALQTAAYAQAYSEHADERALPIKRRMVVQLRSDGSYNTCTHANKLDLPAFIAALTLKQWREQNA